MIRFEEKFGLSFSSHGNYGDEKDDDFSTQLRLRRIVNMAVSRKRSNGSGSIYKRGDNFYLQYMQKDGKRKNITLKNSQGNHIRERREAEEAARKFLQEQQQLKEIETREEYLAELKVVRKLRARLLITLDNAFDLAQAKPHSRETSNRVLVVSRGYWFDFVDFVKSNYQLYT